MIRVREDKIYQLLLAAELRDLNLPSEASPGSGRVERVRKILRTRFF